MNLFGASGGAWLDSRCPFLQDFYSFATLGRLDIVSCKH